MSLRKPLRVVFAGTPTFAALALDAILASAHRVAGVLTQPDRPSGRGHKLIDSPVKARALAAGLPLLQPASLRDPAAQQALQALRPDVIVVAAYGLILPQAVLDMAPMGCLNIHASLLPRWRGAAPIMRAIQAGDRESGVCIMKMEAGLDTGPVAITRRTPIFPADTAGSLHDRLAQLGAAAIVEALDALAGVDSTGLQFQPQSADGVTYARKIEKSEARIDWRQQARVIADHIRALDPQPGAVSSLARQPEVSIRLFAPAAEVAVQPRQADAADLAGVSAVAGEVLAVTATALLVAAGGGILGVAELQRPGGRRVAVADFIRGHRIEAGDLFLPA